MKYLILPILLLSLTHFSFGQNYFNKLIDLGNGSPEAYSDIIYDNATNSLWISGSVTGSVHPKLFHFDLDCNALDTFNVDSPTLVNGQFYTGYGSSFFIDNQDNLIITGQIDTINSEGNAMVSKLNQTTGDTIWTKGIGNPLFFDYITSGIADSDSTYIFAGATGTLVNSQYVDMWLLKTDTAGNILWQNNFGGGGHEISTNLEITIDGGFIISGYTSSFGAGGNDIYIVKTDANGNFLWQKTFGGVNSEGGYVRSLSNGNILVFGSINAIQNGTLEDAHHGFVVLLNNVGVELWSKTYSTIPIENNKYYIYNEVFNSCVVINDGYVFCGFSADSLDNNPLGWLVKTDFNGNQLWSRRFRKRNSSNYMQDIVALPGGDLVMVGFVFAENNTQTQDGWLVRTNCLGFDAPPLALGTWHNAVDNTVILENNSKRFGDGKILWGDGETTTFTEFDDTLISHTYINSGSYNAKLIVNACYHTDTITISVQSTVTNLAEFSLKNTFKLYPNPTQSNVNITYNINDLSDESVLNIYDLTGKLIYTLTITDQHNNIEIPLIDFGKGIYLVNITSNKGDSVTKKLIVQ